MSRAVIFSLVCVLFCSSLVLEAVAQETFAGGNKGEAAAPTNPVAIDGEGHANVMPSTENAASPEEKPDPHWVTYVDSSETLAPTFSDPSPKENECALSFPGPYSYYTGVEINPVQPLNCNRDKQTGYYIISPSELPVGLKFDSRTGALSGTPVEKFGYTTFIITPMQRTGTAPQVSAVHSPITVEIIVYDTTAVIECDPVDVIPLMSLFMSTNGHFWSTRDGWGRGNCCSWHGIRCAEGKIFEIALHKNNLRGRLRENFGDFQHLFNVDLHQNAISGLVPASIGKLTELRHLLMSENEFEGPFPSGIQHMPHIIVLWLFQNNFSGSIPSFLGELKDLKEMHLSMNHFTGPIPDIFHRFDKMDTLALNNNKLTGSIPLSVFKLWRLHFLTLQDNELTGEIPSEIGDLINLRILNLRNNKLSGEIPSSIGKVKGLWHMLLAYNQLSGNIPASVADLEELSDLDLKNNQFSGTENISKLPATLTVCELHPNPFPCPLALPMLAIKPCNLKCDPHVSWSSYVLHQYYYTKYGSYYIVGAVIAFVVLIRYLWITVTGNAAEKRHYR